MGVGKSIFNASPDNALCFLWDFFRKSFFNGNASKRNGGFGFLFPPFAKVDYFFQSFLLIGKTAFVNNNTYIIFPFQHFIFYFREKNFFFIFQFRKSEREEKVGGGVLSWNSN